MSEETETTTIYKSKLKWLFIAGFICGIVLGTAIVEIWIR
jgi:hypothetical protein